MNLHTDVNILDELILEAGAFYIMSLNLFEKMPITKALTDESFSEIDGVACNQLELFT